MSKSKPGRFIPYIFLIFFAVLFTFDGIMVYLANKTWQGKYTEEGYEKGMNYNQALALVKKQQVLGWTAEFNFDQQIPKKGKVKATIKDYNQHLIKDARVELKLTRPVQAGYDFTIPLLLVGDSYQSEVIFPLKGQWDFEIRAYRGKDVFQQVKRYIVK